MYCFFYSPTAAVLWSLACWQMCWYFKKGSFCFNVIYEVAAHQASLQFVCDPCGFEQHLHSNSHLMHNTALQSWSYSPSCLVSVLSGTPCLICGRAEELRAGAVCFTPVTAAQRSGSWWTPHPRTSLNRNIIQIHTDVRPLPAFSASRPHAGRGFNTHTQLTFPWEEMFFVLSCFTHLLSIITNGQTIHFS